MNLTGGTPASERLYYVANKWARRISFIPYTRGIILTGSVHKKTASPQSDIDVVIVSRDSRAWLVHAQLFLFLTMLGIRRTKNARVEKICVNATISENNFQSAHLSDGELLWSGRSKLYAIEIICDALHVSHACEAVARKTIAAHVEKKFVRHKNSKSTLLNNTEKQVQYYPPRIQSIDSLKTRKASL